MRLLHRHFIIGVTGGIAAYKTCELVRRLQDEGATVQVIMTEAGSRFVSALTFQALSGRPVYTDAWTSPSGSGPANGMPHIDLSREAYGSLIAPARADCIAQLANGPSESLLAALCLA
ncbi:MAG: flavoprotein, partial [Burkholderiaceae bacterium]